MQMDFQQKEKAIIYQKKNLLKSTICQEDKELILDYLVNATLQQNPDAKSLNRRSMIP